MPAVDPREIVIYEKPVSFKVNYGKKNSDYTKKFKCYSERALAYLKVHLKYPGRYEKLISFPLHGLEEEYDYDTEEEQIYTAKKHMIDECLMAVEFFIKDDPVLLVENLKEAEQKM